MQIQPLKCYKRVPPIYASFYDTRFTAALSAALGMVCLNVSTRMTGMHVIIEPIFRQAIFRCLCAISLNRAVLLYYNVQIKGKEIICMKKILMLCCMMAMLLGGCSRQQPAPQPKPKKEHPVRSVSLSFTGDILMEDALYNWMGKGYMDGKGIQL